jgi:hypothetical protein
VDVAAVQVEQVVLDLLRQRLVVARLPGPVRGRVVQAQEEGLALGRIGRDEVHGALGQQVGQIAFLVLLLAKPQVVGAARVAMGEVVHPPDMGPKNSS